MVRPAEVSPSEAGAAKRSKTLDQALYDAAMARWERGEGTSEDEVILSHALSRQDWELKQMTKKTNSTLEGRRPHPEKYEVSYPSYTTITPSMLRNRWAKGPSKPVFLFYDDRPPLENGFIFSNWYVSTW